MSDVVVFSSVKLVTYCRTGCGQLEHDCIFIHIVDGLLIESKHVQVAVTFLCVNNILFWFKHIFLNSILSDSQLMVQNQPVRNDLDHLCMRLML